MNADKVFWVIARITSPGWLIGLIVVNIILAVASGLISVVLCVGKVITNKKVEGGNGQNEL